jgi:hypothetical protein
MPERSRTELDQIKKSVIWLVNRVNAEHNQAEEAKHEYCRLNDYSAFETQEIIQAMQSEDQI